MYKCTFIVRNAIFFQTALFKIRLQKPISGEEPIQKRGKKTATNGLAFNVCMTCGKKFRTKFGLVKHMKTHTEKTMYDCDYCEKRFSHAAQQSEHIAHCHSFVDMCTVCGKKFAEKLAMVCHMKTHDREKLYKCYLCEWKFPRESLRTNHLMRCHTGDRPFMCTVCRLRFTDARALMRHKRLHFFTTQKQRFRNVFQELFEDVSSTAVYRESQRDQQLGCGYCGQMFEKDDDVKRHFFRMSSIRDKAHFL